MNILKIITLLVLSLAIFRGGPDSAFAVPENIPGKQPGFLEEIPDWQARLELARLLSYTERYQEAVEQYRRVIQIKPDLAEARLELARVLYWKGNVQEAEQMFASVPEKDLPAEARLELADIYLAREEYDKALDIYSDYLRIAPDNHRVRLNKARVLSWQGRYEDSLREYEIILSARPEDKQVRRQFAQVLIWAEKFEQAITELEKTIED